MDTNVRQVKLFTGSGEKDSDYPLVYFVHIPKTAGTSFRLALERDPVFNMLYDYGEQCVESTPLLLAQVAGGAKSLEAVAARDKINVICGHVHFRKYARYVEPRNVLSIVRNPVERLVSEYQHLVRNENYGQSFTDYISTPNEINKQWKMLDGVDLHAGGLFGLASHYVSYLELVRLRFDVPLDAIVTNQAPGEDKIKRHNIVADDVALAFDLNEKEMAQFFQVADVFIESLHNCGVNTLPSNDAHFNCNIERNRQIVGWVSRRPRDCCFVQLSVNEQPRAIVNLDVQRPDVVATGLSEHVLCGFSYPLALLGVRNNDRVGMAVVGSENMRKSIVYRESR